MTDPNIVNFENKGNPIVIEHDGGVFANSRDIAQFFGKQHKNVLRDIENIEIDEEFARLNFELCNYTDQNGRKRKAYNLTKDGFTLLVMGFTGRKANEFKIRYIEAFNKMEEALRAQQEFKIPKTISEALRLAADEHEKVLELEHKIEVASEAVSFVDQFVNADGLYGLQNAARALGQKPNKFVQKLKEKHLFYQGGALVPKAQYRERGFFEVKCTMVDDKARYQTYMTPKGIKHFAEQFEMRESA